MSNRALVSMGAFALLTAFATPVLPGVEDAAEALRIVGEVNKLTEQLRVANPGVALNAPTPIPDSSGAFLSPYKADGSLTAWAEKGMSASVGGAVGGAVGGKMAEGLASKIPFAGGFLGKKAKEKAAATGTVMAAGGWEFIKTSSDISFNTAEELAVYLQAKHAGVDPDFAKALGTAFGIYPALKTAYEPAVKAAIEAARAAPATGAATPAAAAPAAAAPAAPAPAAGPVEVATYAVNLKDFELKTKALTRSNKVVVPGFRVAFVIKDKVTASVAAGYQLGGTHTSGASSTTEVELVGLDYAALQAITDRAYSDFIADLKAAGREVVSLEQLQATEGFKGIEATPSSPDKPYIKEASFGQTKHVIVLSAGGLPLWWENGNQLGDKGPFAQVNMKAMNAISFELDAVVLVPTYVVTFAELSGSGNKGGLFAGYKSGAETSAKPSIGLGEMWTQMLTMHAKNKFGGDMYWVRLNERLSFGDYGAEMVTAAKDSNANSGARASLQGLAKATGNMGFFAAAGATRSSQALVVRPDPARFSGHALAAIRAANTAYMEAVKKNAP